MCTLRSKAAFNFRRHGGFFLNDGETAVCPDTLQPFVKQYIAKLTAAGIVSVEACIHALPEPEAVGNSTAPADAPPAQPELLLAPFAESAPSGPLPELNTPAPDTHSHDAKRHGKRRR
jgi:hypothetical protein